MMRINRLAAAGLIPIFLMPSLASGQWTDGVQGETLRAEHSPQGPTGHVDPSETSRLIIELTNDFRRSQGLDATREAMELRDTARYFAHFMARTDEFGHQADDSRPSDRAARHGYEYCLISENIAYQYDSVEVTTDQLARRFVEGWKESSEHRRNMLDSAVQDVGVAVAQSEQTGVWYAVQMFGRRASSAIEFDVENQSDREISYRLADRAFSLPPRFTRTHRLCRPARLTLDFPEENPSSMVVESGVRFVVEQQGDQLILRGK